MTGFMQLASMLREQMSATLSRSDVLKPLAWLVGLLIALLVLSLWIGVDSWLLRTEIALIIISVALYMVAFVFCLLRNPDALRSEKYSLHKMAIEQGVYGDSRTGLIEPEGTTSPMIAGTVAGETRAESDRG